MSENLRVEWTPITNATVVSLIGTVDARALPLIREVVRSAPEIPRLLVDLEMVTAVDDHGVEILESLIDLRNVGLISLSPVIEGKMEELGRLL